jgi:hypothetical protein
VINSFKRFGQIIKILDHQRLLRPLRQIYLLLSVHRGQKYGHQSYHLGETEPLQTPFPE